MNPLWILAGMVGTAVVTAGLVVLLMKGSGSTGGGITLPPNWKTSLSGLVTGLAGWIVLSPQDFVNYPIVISFAKYVMAGGFVAMGLSAKDSTTHSTVQEMQAATIKAAEVPKEPVK